MAPRPSTVRNGEIYSYYVCTRAEKSVDTECKKEYIPADAVGRVILDFLRHLKLKPDVIKGFVEKANLYASSTLQKLEAEKQTIQARLSVVRTKISNISDAIAEQGKEAFNSLEKALANLETEETELEESLNEVKRNIEIEYTDAIETEDQVRSLTLFNQLIDHPKMTPERLKSIIPKFIDYIVWHPVDENAGHLEIALFHRPISRGSKDTLREVVKELTQEESSAIPTKSQLKEEKCSSNSPRFTCVYQMG